MFLSNMSKLNTKRKISDKTRTKREKENPNPNPNPSHVLSKHLKKIYPFGLQKSNSSSLSLSSLSLSLSQNSNDSTVTDSGTPLEQKIQLALRLIAPHHRKEFPLPIVTKTVTQQQEQQNQDSGNGEVKRCNWITKNSDKVYIAFHDEEWGVPVYDDNLLFELLALCGMLMDYNWTEILKRKEQFREAFSEFDPNIVAKMEEKEIMEIASNKDMMLAESRVRAIVENAKCILKVASDYGSFSAYIWGYVNHKPTINRFKYPRNVPLRSPKAEALSKDLLKHGFRLVGPVIVYSFMQAAGLTIDHLVDCYRYNECVGLAERPWRHI